MLQPLNPLPVMTSLRAGWGALCLLATFSIPLSGACGAESANPQFPSNESISELSDFELGSLFLVKQRKFLSGASGLSSEKMEAFLARVYLEMRRRGKASPGTVYNGTVSSACRFGFESGVAKFELGDSNVRISRNGRWLQGVVVGDTIAVLPPSELQPLVGIVSPERITLIERSGSCSITFVAPATLHEAVDTDDVGTVKTHITFGADVNASDAWGPPLSVAVARGSLEIVALLLDHGADIEGATSSGSGGLRPLHIAASSMKRPEVVSLLIRRGAKVEARDGAGRTPLIAAVGADNIAAAEVLIAAGADPNLPDALHLLPPILWAAGSGGLKTAELLLSRDVDVNQKWGRNGKAALHMAAAHNQIQIVPLLIRHGANVDSANNLGETPLKLSCHEAMRTLLRAYGASK